MTDMADRELLETAFRLLIATLAGMAIGLNRDLQDKPVGMRTLGLVSLGFDWTVLSRSPWPDHGLFGHGKSRLYVHRGTGFYGFPLRIGVPGEASVLELVPES